MNTDPEERPVESRDPVTGEVWQRWIAEGEEGVGRAVESAREAQKAWATRSVEQRARVLANARHLMAESRAEIVSIIQRENGKPRVEALLEVLTSAEFARYYAKIAPRSLREKSVRPSSIALWRKRVRVVCEPLGVIGIITPWNYPFLLANGLVLPALVAGNAVVLKPSEYTSASSFHLVELLRQAGLPENILTVLPGAGRTGAALVRSGIDKIFFVGSEAAGRKVYAAAAEHLIPCSLELGGSDPAIVLEDADLENAALGLTWGRFSNGAQTCVAPKRIFVVDPVFARFLDAIESRVARMTVGIDGDVGPMIRPSQRQTIERQFQGGIDGGATIFAQATADSGDTVFPPTVLTDVDPDSIVLKEETFGPILPIIRVQDEEEAIRRANGTQFGLSASIWSRDLRRARRVARRLDVGSVTINDSLIVPAIANVSYGGRKSSGVGVSHGVDGLMACVNKKPIIEDPFTGWPETYWHPYTKGKTEGIDSFVEFSHGRGLYRRIAAGLRAAWKLYF